jgi:hypothetical protein
MDIQAQKEAMIANASDMALQARLLELSNSGRADEVARIENFLASLKGADPSGIITQRFKEEFSVFGGVVTEQSGVLEQILQRANVDVDEIAKQVQAGTIDNATIIANILGAANEALSPGAGDAGTSIFDRMFGNFGDRANIVTPRNERALDNNFLGGNVQAGDFSMVGERGPELVRFGSNGEVINNATTQDIMGAANQVANNIGNNNNIDYSQQTLDVLTAMAREQSDTKRLLQKILPKAMASNGYF